MKEVFSHHSLEYFLSTPPFTWEEKLPVFHLSMSWQPEAGEAILFLLIKKKWNKN
jgi:hypothetical protein